MGCKLVEIPKPIELGFVYKNWFNLENPQNQNLKNQLSWAD